MDLGSAEPKPSPEKPSRGRGAVVTDSTSGIGLSTSGGAGAIVAELLEASGIAVAFSSADMAKAARSPA